MKHFRESLVDLLRNQCISSVCFGAEVGVHRGRLSLILLTSFPRLHLYMVDLWDVSHSREYLESGDPCAGYTRQEQEGFYRETLEYIRYVADRAEVLRMDSVAAVSFMQPLDFAFIDADHTKSGCRRDIEHYWNAVKPGGILCGHDYNKSDVPGVTEAVQEFSRNRALIVNEADGNIWWVRKI